MESSIVPGIYDPKVHDRKVSVYTEDAYEMVCRWPGKRGFFWGTPGGPLCRGPLRWRKA